MKLHQCRSCNSHHLEPVISFGETPLAEVLLREEQLSEPELLFPLELVFCSACALLQLSVTVPPDLLYAGEYPYYSSVVETLVTHFGASAQELIQLRNLGPGSLVIEVASNDGYMLKKFVSCGVQVLGIDPAKGPAEAARKAGVPTLAEFFSQELAESLQKQNIAADVLLANNVINLVDDLNGFVAGVKALLKDCGVAVIEMPYVRDLIGKGAFDSIYHQNLCYFSITSLVALFRRHELFINDALRVSTFGGSLRIFVEKHPNPSEALKILLAEEERLGLARKEFYLQFGERIEKVKRDLLELLGGLRKDGKRIAVFGAAGGMATTLLNYVGIDRSLVEFAVDSNPHKQGFYTAGGKLRIHAPDHLVTAAPEYTLLLAWNYAEEIMSGNKGYLDAGGRFIVPIPRPEILAAS